MNLKSTVALNVAVLGASNNPERYSYKAVVMLKEHGHIPYPVHPSRRPVAEVNAVASLSELPKPIDTLTMYVGPEISTKLRDEIIALAPRRVIFNPGAENAELQLDLRKAGIEVTEACTLVLLRTGQF